MRRVADIVQRLVTSSLPSHEWLIRVFLSATVAFTLQLSTLSRLVVIGILVVGGHFCVGIVGAIRALFASIIAGTAVVATVVKIDPKLAVHEITIAGLVMLSFVAVCAASHVDKLRRASPSTRTSPDTEAFVVVPLLLLAFFMRRWMGAATPAQVFGLFGSEDNAAWLSVARGFANDDISVSGMTHPTAKSPAVGVFTGVMSWLTGIGSDGFELQPHVHALETVRNSFALLILSGALVAGSLAAQVRSYGKHISKWHVSTISLFVVVVQAMLLTSLFFEHGFLSYMGAIVFALLLLELATNNQAAWHRPSYLTAFLGTLLALGLSSHWWGTAPIGALTAVIVLFSYLRTTDRRRTSTYVFLGSVVVVSGAVLTQLWDLIVGDAVPMWVFAATGTVPLPSPLLIVVMVAVIVLLIHYNVLGSQDDDGGRRSVGEQLLIFLALYAMSVWAISVVRTGTDNYAANKMIFMLLPISAPLWFLLAARTSTREQPSKYLLRYASAFFLIAFLSNGWLFIRGPQLNEASFTKQQVIAALDENPDSIVLCLHTDEANRIGAYVCSRFAQGLSRSESVFTNNWLNAIVYPDRSPNGILIPEEQTSGGRALIELRKILVSQERDVSIVVTPDTQFDPSSHDWDDNFWWLRDVPWEQLTIVR